MGFIPSGARETLLAEIEAREPEPETLPFPAGVAASYEAAALTERSDSLSTQLRDGIVNSINRARDLGLNPPALPSVDVMSNRQIGVYADWLDTRKDAIAALRSDPNGPPDPFLKTGEELRSDGAARVALARERAAGAGWLANLVGTGAALGTDLPNLAVMALAPGIGSAETIFGRLGIEFVAGATSQVVTEAASLPAKESAGVTPTAGQMAGNVLLTGGLSAALPVAFHGVGLATRRLAALEKYRAGVRSGEIIETRETQAAADAIQDHIDTVKPGVSPQAELATLEAVDAATAVHTAEHPTLEAAALRRLDEKVAAVARAEATAGARTDPTARPTVAELEELHAGLAPRVAPATVEAAIAREAEAPTIHAPESPLIRGEAAPAPVDALDEVTRASFDAATELNPELRASYTTPDGPVAGNARALMQAAQEDEALYRQILDCVLSGGVNVPV